MRLKPYLSPALLWVFLFLAALELGLRSSPYVQFWFTNHHSTGILAPYIFNCEELKIQGPRIRLLLLGDSIAMMGVDACQLARELGLAPFAAFNFSHGGAGPVSQLKNYQALRPYLPGLQAVVVFVNFEHLCQAGDGTRTVAEDFLKDSGHPFGDAWAELSLSPVLRHYSLAMQLAPFWQFKAPAHTFGLWPRPCGGTTVATRQKKSLAVPALKPIAPDDVSISSLHELLVLLHAQGVKVQALVLPRHPDYEAAISERGLFVRRLLDRYAAEGLLDFYPEAFQGLSSTLAPYYYDVSHLLPSGAVILTHALAQHLKQHPLPVTAAASVPGRSAPAPACPASVSDQAILSCTPASRAANDAS